MMETALQKLLNNREELLKKLQAARDEVIAETGAFDKNLYHAKLMERGLAGQLGIIDAQIGFCRKLNALIGDSSNG
ncbi:MAG TPA: hypothetical protein PKH92_04955 [Anaerolineaceae bacterium]|nr:hypothetical protein [Anaerolineaceae bacterium]